MTVRIEQLLLLSQPKASAQVSTPPMFLLSSIPAWPVPMSSFSIIRVWDSALVLHIVILEGYLVHPTLRGQ